MSSIVQVVGISVCLHAASKISHKAQRVASIASRWHALVTCNSSLRGSNSVNNFEATANSMASSIPTNFSESDLESLDSVGPPPNYTRLASHAASYNKRQAFGMYFKCKSLQFLCSFFVYKYKKCFVFFRTFLMSLTSVLSEACPSAKFISNL